MKTLHEMHIEKDVANKKIIINRIFEARLEKVWDYWTRPEFLDQWWAPKPWKAETKKLDFRVDGDWLYAMIGPDKVKVWSKSTYTAIDKHKSFEGDDMFTDESGKTNKDMPKMHWKNIFKKVEEGTQINIEITFEKESDIHKTLEMGFEQGIEAAMKNLDELLEPTLII
jgi:PhnB protein